MERGARDFLIGFARAALLVQSLRACPPSYTSAVDYMKDVADLNADADDPMRRGLAVGCRAAVGKE